MKKTPDGRAGRAVVVGERTAAARSPPLRRGRSRARGARAPSYLPHPRAAEEAGRFDQQDDEHQHERGRQQQLRRHPAHVAAEQVERRRRSRARRRPRRPRCRARRAPRRRRRRSGSRPSSIGWSRTLGLAAAIIPATAPSIAASPQPSESIQLTRTPTRRAASGRTAAARIARPTFVNWKKSQRTNTDDDRDRDRARCPAARTRRRRRCRCAPGTPPA